MIKMLKHYLTNMLQMVQVPTDGVLQRAFLEQNRIRYPRKALGVRALQRVLAGVAPRLATALGQKLMAQAVPVLGAIAGAGLNAAFLGYYREVAHVRFALLRLCERHGTEQVIAAFGKAVQPARVTRA